MWQLLTSPSPTETTAACWTWSGSMRRRRQSSQISFANSGRSKTPRRNKAGGAASLRSLFLISSRWPSSSGGGLQNRRDRCDSGTGFHFQRSQLNREWTRMNANGDRGNSSILNAGRIPVRVHSRLNRFQTLPTHHFRIRGEITVILRFERRVCRWESCRMRQPSLCRATARQANFTPR